MVEATLTISLKDFETIKLKEYEKGFNNSLRKSIQILQCYLDNKVYGPPQFCDKFLSPEFEPLRDFIYTLEDAFYKNSKDENY